MKKFILTICIFLLGMINVYAKEEVKFSKCIDGDTIKILLEDKEYTVRMLAIDTPESVHPTKEVEYYGKESSEYTCQMITNAKKIELEYDQNSEKMDKYDRLLAWVFVDSELLQEKLIENGYAKIAYLYGDYKYVDLLKSKQELASANNLGIWDTNKEEEYNKKNNITEDLIDNSDKLSTSIANETGYSKLDIITIMLLIIIIVFISNKTIKSKAEIKLKKYLN